MFNDLLHKVINSVGVIHTFDRNQWVLVFVVVTVAGFLMLRGLGSKTIL